MQFSIISASHQKNSQSLRVAHYFDGELKKNDTSCVIDLQQENLPLWSAEFFDDEKKAAQWDKLANILKKSDGFVFISPEYGGMASPCLKNFFLFAKNEDLGHKPGLIVSVSSGVNGAYPVADIRSCSYKNNHICFIPDQIIIRYAADVLHGDAPQNKDDQYIRDRIKHAIFVLLAYANALKYHVRKNSSLLFDEFPHGM